MMRSWSMLPAYMRHLWGGGIQKPSPPPIVLDVPGRVVILRGVLQPRGGNLEQLPGQRVQHPAIRNVHLPGQNPRHAVGIVLVRLAGWDEIDRWTPDALGVIDARHVAIADCDATHNLVVGGIDRPGHSDADVLVLHDIDTEDVADGRPLELVLAALVSLQGDVLERAIDPEVTGDFRRDETGVCLTPARRLGRPAPHRRVDRVELLGCYTVTRVVGVERGLGECLRTVSPGSWG